MAAIIPPTQPTYAFAPTGVYRPNPYAMPAGIETGKTIESILARERSPIPTPIDQVIMTPVTSIERTQPWAPITPMAVMPTPYGPLMTPLMTPTPMNPWVAPMQPWTAPVTPIMTPTPMNPWVAPMQPWTAPVTPIMTPSPMMNPWAAPITPMMNPWTAPITPMMNPWAAPMTPIMTPWAAPITPIMTPSPVMNPWAASPLSWTQPAAPWTQPMVMPPTPVELAQPMWNIASRPSIPVEQMTLEQPIRIVDAEGRREMRVCCDLRGFKPEEITVTLNKAERAVVIEATAEAKDGKEHQVARKYSRKVMLPESPICKIDIASCGPLSAVQRPDGLLIVELPLPKLTAEEMARYPQDSYWTRPNTVAPVPVKSI